MNRPVLYRPKPSLGISLVGERFLADLRAKFTWDTRSKIPDLDIDVFAVFGDARRHFDDALVLRGF